MFIKPKHAKGSQITVTSRMLPTLQTLVNRVEKTYYFACDQLLPEDWVKAKNWYRIEGARIAKIAETQGYEHERVCAIVAALSPRNNWEQNLKDTYSVLSDAHPDNISVCTYTANKMKAYAIKHAPLSEIYSFFSDVTGRKTHSFTDNLVNPESSQAVTIDIWMYRALCKLPVNTSASGTLDAYLQLESAVQKVAYKLDLMPHELQAIIWVSIKSWVSDGYGQLSFLKALMNIETAEKRVNEQ